MTNTVEIHTVDMHTGGEPVRVVVDGYPDILGETILDKRRYARENLDHLRRMLMYEPRGHSDMYGVLPIEPDHPEAHLGVLFIHNEGYSTMCGHGTIALGRWAVDSGMVEPEEPETVVNLQVPSGLVRIKVSVEGGRTGTARYESVPSFLLAADRAVEVPGYGEVVVDVAYGGAFYALVDAGRLGVQLETSSIDDIVAAAWATTGVVAADVDLRHPDHPDLEQLYGTIITDGADEHSEGPTRNVCVFAERQVDRSPTGSGVQARLATQVAKGLISVGQARTFESIIGSRFSGTVLRQEKVGEFDAVVVEVGGDSYYTGESKFVLEADDPLPGFLVR